MIKRKKLSIDEMEEIYHTYLVKDFPPMEVKPFQSICTMASKGIYSGYGFYEDGELMGYAFFCENTSHTYALLDYYAITAGKRGRGYGQKIFEIIRDTYSDYQAVILESENVDFAQSAKDKETRTRRINFYQERCGLKNTGLTSCVYDVEYVLFAIPCQIEPTGEDVCRELSDIYSHILPPHIYEKKVRIGS